MDDNRDAADSLAIFLQTAGHAVHVAYDGESALQVAEGLRPEVAIIDCDGVQLRAVTPRDRQAAFERLCRSIRRLDPTSAVVTLDCVEALRSIAPPLAGGGDRPAP